MGRVMAEAPNLMVEARDLLATPSHERLESLVLHLSTRQQSTEYQSALPLFVFCTHHFANCFTLKLLKMYRSSSDAALRSKSIFLLSETLADYKSRRFELSLVALNEIKPLLVSCLRMQDSQEIKLFRRILSFIAHDVVMLDNGGWDELSDCIVELSSSSQPLNALHVFVELPPVYARFISICGKVIVEKAAKVLLVPDQERVEDWSLGLQAVVKLGVQHLDTEMRVDLVKYLLNLLAKAASDLVKKGMEPLLVRGLEDLERFLARDKSLYAYNKLQCDFVSTFLSKIKDLGTLTTKATGKIHRILKSSPSPQDHGAASSEREWLERLNKSSPLEILKIFADTDVEERFRELAIRRLDLVLFEYISREEATDISVLRELQPLLISCLSSKEGISESMFKVLGEVVYHVACEMMNFHNETWYDLCDYIASNSKTEFERAVYIFQCLTMRLVEEFMYPIVESLLPEIIKRLDPPREVLVDNSCWVLAFLGAFCTIIHLGDIGSYAVKEITDKMVDSVRELVERKMEVGLVRRAFRDLESIVMKEEEWFGKKEYELIKALLQRFYLIKGMKMESKVVLWRINVSVDRGMTELAVMLSEER